MKKNRIIIIAAAALALGACSVEENLAPKEEGIRFTTNLGVFTKATDTNFESGDAVSLFAEEPIEALNVKMNFVNGELVPERQISWPENADTSASTSFFAIYPYREDWEDYTDLTVFSVNADQRTHELYTASDLMGAAYMAYPGCRSVPLNFTHRLSKVTVEVFSDAGIVSEVYIVNAYGKARMHIFHNMDVYAVGVPGTINMGLVQEEPYGKNTSLSVWKAIVPPQYMEFKIAIVMENGDKYFYAPPIWSDIYMQSGKIYSTSISLEPGSEPYGDIPSVSDWTADNDKQFGDYVSDRNHTEGDWAMRKPGTEEWTWMNWTYDGVETAVAYLTVSAGDQFEFVYAIGRRETQYGTGEALSDGVYRLVEGGKPVSFSTTGDYVVSVNPVDEMISIAPDTDVWSVVGEFGDKPWETDYDMVRESPGVYTIELDYHGEAFKFRCNHSWDKNYGSYYGTLEPGYWYPLNKGGENISLSQAGKYKLILDLKNVRLGVQLLESYVTSRFEDFLGTWMYGDQAIAISQSGTGEYQIDLEDGVCLKAFYNQANGNLRSCFVIHNEWYWDNYKTRVFDYYYAFYIDQEGKEKSYFIESESEYLFEGVIDEGGRLQIVPGKAETGDDFTRFMVIGLLQEGDYAGAYVQMSGGYPLPMTWTRAN